MFLVDKIVGDENKRAIKKIQPIVDRINSLEPDFEKLSLEELRAKTDEFKKRLSEGEALDDVLPEAFAAVRESARRTLGQRHYDVQLIGGVALHEGNIAEMRTGEGKTLVGTLPTYLNALTGRGVHVITVNDYLSRRDAVWMGQIYAALGMSVGVINHDASYIYDAGHKEADQERDETGSFHIVYDFLRPVERKEAYAADITYGTNNEFGFDYLRDNIEYDAKNLRQREHHYAIVDEIDSILIDEARTPLIISAPAADSESLYQTFTRIAATLKEGDDFTIDEKLKAATLTDSGIEKAEKALGVENIYTDKGIKYVHHLETAVRAKAIFLKDRDYVVRDGEVVIVDEFTGRLQPGRRWSEGLHQAIESKEGVRIQRESRTFASVTFQNYFRMYEKLAGMTGTGRTSSEEFYTVYGLDVLSIPTHRDIARLDRNDLIFQTEEGKFKAIARKIKELHEKGQPVLVGTVSIEKNELLSNFLEREGVPHEVLNAKQHENEGELIAQAGKKGRVVIATNMAGRGVDIKLGGNPSTDEEYNKIKEMGGLFVLGTERHEARRIDDQLRGRSGRQGDPGETQFFVSLEDHLMRVFASDSVKNMMGRFGIPEDQPIENKMITRSLESAQKKIEGFNFDARKQILAYDNVLNQQRQTIYEKRRTLLLGTHEEVQGLLDEAVAGDAELEKVIEEKKKLFGEEIFYEAVRKLYLQTIDMLWVEHLELMDYTRNSVNLRAYGQRDPLIEYRKEGTRLFGEMQEAIIDRLLEMLPHMNTGALKEEEERLKKTQRDAQLVGGSSASREGNGNVALKPKTNRTDDGAKIGRNDVVEITNGTETREMKYKKAEPMLESGEWKLVA